MIINKYPAPPVEKAAERYDRDYLNIPDLDTSGDDDYRRDRTLLRQPVERKSRRYVDDGISAVTGGAPVFDPTVGDPTDPVDPEASILWEDFFLKTPPSAPWEFHGSHLPPGATPDPTIEGGSLFQITRPNLGGDMAFEFDLELPDRAPETGEFFMMQAGPMSEDPQGNTYGAMIMCSWSTDNGLSSPPSMGLMTLNGAAPGTSPSEANSIVPTNGTYRLSYLNGMATLSRDGVDLVDSAPVSQIGEGSVMIIVQSNGIGGSISRFAQLDLT